MFENPAPGKLRNLSWVCDRLKSQLSVTGNQTVIDERGGWVSHAGQHIAAYSCIWTMVLLTLPITTFIYIYYRENLIDLPACLMLRDTL